MHVLQGLFFEDIFYILDSELGLERAYGYARKHLRVRSASEYFNKLQLIHLQLNNAAIFLCLVLFYRFTPWLAVDYLIWFTQKFNRRISVELSEANVEWPSK